MWEKHEAFFLPLNLRLHYSLSVEFEGDHWDCLLEQ